MNTPRTDALQATTSPQKNSSTSLANLGPFGKLSGAITLKFLSLTVGLFSQIRQGIAQNTKGTAFVVYEDVMDAKQACDKLNGFNFQNRYLVGMCSAAVMLSTRKLTDRLVLYHQPEKMVKTKEDLAERQENLEKLKKQHGID